MIEIVIFLLIVGFVAWLISLAPFIAEPFKRIAIGVLCLLAIIYVLLAISGGAPMPRWNLR